MMKRRWSNNGGFALRVLEESSSEVTSSSALAPAVAMSPTSIGSSEYNDMDMWNYEESAGFPPITNPHAGGGGGSGGANHCVGTGGSAGNNPTLQNNIPSNINMTTFGSTLSSMQLDIRLNGSGRSRSSIQSMSPGKQFIIPFHEAIIRRLIAFRIKDN